VPPAPYRRLSLFGSMLRGDAGPDSDVDLLVEFSRDAKPSFFDLTEIERELSGLLAGDGWICVPPRI
jgi:uncharacterized protein